ncbi:MAG: hypothetical protein HY682_02195 [Chloroflexi bacterium]|nr:hypothetical protein [Chloroflexota bacterium]
MATHQPRADFPIPSDAKGFLQWDKMHCPRPLTPMAQEVFDALSRGFTGAMDTFGCPVGLFMKAINYYGYATMVPFPDHDSSERLTRYERTLREVLPRMGELWEKEWLPSIIPGLEHARKTDHSLLSDGELADTLERMFDDLHQRFVVHGKINFVTVSASMFADFYNENFQPADPTEPYATLQGYPTRSLDAGRGLWRLRGLIRSAPEVQKAFQTLPVIRLVSALQQSPAGKKFLQALAEYLEEFGWRSDVFEPADKPWREEPTIPLNALQGYIRLQDSDDPDVRYRTSIETRNRLLAEARGKLASDPVKLARFNELHDIAKHYLPITENHNFYIDQIGIAVLRLPLLEIGSRLVRKGLADDADSVFMLYRKEVPGAMAGKDARPIVAQRRAELTRWSKVIPVPAIGEPPPHGDKPDPLGTAFGKMFGLPVEPSRDPDVIAGIGASKGVARGTAKVVRDLSEASKLQKGDIMVCELTMPPWTPLFSTVSALVADTGGVLSHCAIVSREYGLPAVVGTRIGTAVLQDGMRLTVDGSKGIVRIDSRT